MHIVRDPTVEIALSSAPARTADDIADVSYKMKTT